MAGEFESLYLKEDRAAPQITGNIYLVDGEIRNWTGKTCNITSPVLKDGKPVILGSFCMLTSKESLEAAQSASKAFNHGRGEWPSMTTLERIKVVEKFIKGLQEKHDHLVNLIMWEICKSKDEAIKEIDRTIVYLQDTISALKKNFNEDSTFVNDQGITAQIRRTPLGVVLCVGPFNYPFNETYTTLLPALLMGNTVVLKIPRTGGACHFPTLSLFRDLFPKGVVNAITGSGRETLPPIMQSGLVDALAFIGTSKAADDLIKNHPKPHRLKTILGLEAKNPAIILPDADVEGVAVPECLAGSLSYNGQRCTAIKIIFVHKSLEERFVKKFVEAVDSLKMGLPWDSGVKITPLAEENKPEYLKSLTEDAISKGGKKKILILFSATVANARGHKYDRTFSAPTVLVNVKPNMRIYNEEQFGPIVPIVTFENISQVFDYMAQSNYGQQVSIFGEKDIATISTVIDDMVHQVARVNINTLCKRGPDSMPFGGRKDSAIGTLSVRDALKSFSMRSVVATTVDKQRNTRIFEEIVKGNSSKFLNLGHLF